MNSILVSTLIMGLVSTGLCIECYVGTGDVGDEGVKLVDGFKSCTIKAGEKGIIRAGSVQKMNTTRTLDLGNIQGAISSITNQANELVCQTTGCNSAPAIATAFMPIIIMALLAKFIF